MNITIRDIREAWILAALNQWDRNVRDEHQSPTIKHYFRSVGWGFWVDDQDGYRNNAKHAWCGIFQGYCGLRIGEFLAPNQCVPIYLSPEIAKYVLPSTARAASIRRWRQAGVDLPLTYRPHAADQWSEVNDGGFKTSADVLQRGTIATIAARDYGDERNEYGGHWILIAEHSGDYVRTIEGNASGKLPDGTTGEGVIRRERKVSDIRRVYHLDFRHFEFLGASTL